MSYGRRNPMIPGGAPGAFPAFTSGGAPLTKTMGPDLQGQLAQLISQTPGPYDADMEYRARRRMVEELLGNIRPAGPSAHLITGVGRF